MEKKGRPRPEGYRMEIEAAQAAVVLCIFTSYAGGQSLTQIVKTLNEESVPGSIRAAKGWSPATVSRILDNEKYSGRRCWNKTETRRDPRTGRRRRFEKPESDWIVHEDEALRIVPTQLWATVRQRRTAMHRTWPGGKRGFSKEQGSRQKHFPTHLLAGSMVCGCCGATITQVSGKSGGYYGCLAATKGACENKTLVRRTLAEEVIVDAVREEVDGLRRSREKIFRPPPIEWSRSAWASSKRSSSSAPPDPRRPCETSSGRSAWNSSRRTSAGPSTGRSPASTHSR